MLIIKVCISFGLLALLFYMTDTTAFIDRVSDLSPVYILLGWLYYSVCQVISAYRWQLFLTVKNIHVSMLRLFNFYMVGMFLNNFLPGAVGGDAVKSYDLYKYTKKGSLCRCFCFS